MSRFCYLIDLGGMHRRNPTRWSHWLVTVPLITLVGCGYSSRHVLQSSERSDAGSTVLFTSESYDKVDVLFVVDNSASMAEEQESLAESLEQMVSALLSERGEGDGLVAPSSAHFGFVSTDMGTAGYADTCPANPEFGDDGVLQPAGREAADCELGEARYVRYDSDADDGRSPMELADDLACTVRLGAHGCGFEQPLEAMLKALVPSNSDIGFVGNTVGHGDAANAGFLRDDSVLAIVLLTDEDDCSAADPGLYAGSSDAYPGPLQARCTQYDDALWPLDRYANGLLSLRPEAPHAIVFAPIVGVPTDVAGGYVSSILDDPRLNDSVDAMEPTCEDPDTMAFAPLRLLETAELLEDAGASSLVWSTCTNDLNAWAEAIAVKIQVALGPRCLPSPRNRDEAGLIECEVHETLPAGFRCNELTSLGREETPIRTEDDGREVCLVRQRAVTDNRAPVDPGWYYDDFSDDVASKCRDERRQTIAFTPESEPMQGAETRLWCPW